MSWKMILKWRKLIMSLLAWLMKNLMNNCWLNKSRKKKRKKMLLFSSRITWNCKSWKKHQINSKWKEPSKDFNSTKHQTMLKFQQVLPLSRASLTVISLEKATLNQYRRLHNKLECNKHKEENKKSLLLSLLQLAG